MVKYLLTGLVFMFSQSVLGCDCVKPDTELFFVNSDSVFIGKVKRTNLHL
jgi:hypothetical protein